MRSALVAACLVLGSPAAARAESPANLPASASATAEQFLTELKQGQAPEAFHYAFHDIEPEMGSQTIESAAAQFTATLKTFGGIIDWSSYETDHITPHLIRQTYFVRCQNIPLFLTVQFYDAGKGWRIVDVQFNTYTNGRNAGFFDAERAARAKSGM